MKEPFQFTNGQSALNLEDLVTICEKCTTDAIYHLNRKDFENWLDYIGETELAAQAKQARFDDISDLEALQQFLASCKSAIATPVKHNNTEDLPAPEEGDRTEESVSFSLSQLENPLSIPLSTATRLELIEEEEILPTADPVAKLSQGALIDKKTDTRFEFPTTKNTIYIGRANEDLSVQIDISTLEDAEIISRVHAVIKIEDEKFFLEDAGSANGTWLNGEKLKPGLRFRKEISSGDEIAFGKKQSIKFTFEKES